jgi:excisionase family DNA binding protein
MIRDEVRQAVAAALAERREPPPPVWLTLAEVAEVVRVHQRTVRTWIRTGRLPAARVGNIVRVRRSHLDAVLEGRGV